MFMKYVVIIHNGAGGRHLSFDVFVKRSVIDKILRKRPKVPECMCYDPVTVCDYAKEFLENNKDYDFVFSGDTGWLNIKNFGLKNPKDIEGLINFLKKELNTDKIEIINKVKW